MAAKPQREETDLKLVSIARVPQETGESDESP